VEHTTIPAPYEGQFVIELDDTVWYYSNSTWRPVGATMWPTRVDLLDPLVSSYFGYQSFNGTYSTTNFVALGLGSSEAPWGYYHQSGASDNDVELSFITRLGPRGSIWIPAFDLFYGTDCGKFKVGINKIDETGSGAVPGVEQAGMISDPDDDVTYDGFPLFFPGDVSASGGWGWNWDAYAASNGWDIAYGNQIRLMGSDEALSTTSATIVGSYMELDSGAGMYEVRVVSDGKRAASTNYRKRFGSFRMIRMTERYSPVS